MTEITMLLISLHPKPPQEKLKEVALKPPKRGRGRQTCGFKSRCSESLTRQQLLALPDLSL